ncbi:MAG: protein translocase subunit SecF [Nanoarchaeota archaeon]|nr:protein translocase subunit SecF [Nanoarchaeota archaeon]MCA9495889.1 protein translocase subunit SecF [Nanoarchaeota archaeon]
MSKKHKKQEEVIVETLSEKLSKFYKKSYKFFMVIPVIFFILAIYFIFQTIPIDGTPIYRDVSLKGGVSAIVNIDSVIGQEELLTKLENQYKQNSFSVSELYSKGVRSGFVIDTDLEDNELKSLLNTIFETKFVDGENYNSNVISPSLSNAFFSQAIKILIVSFVLMSIVIFIYFREFVPSFAVVLSGLFDLIVTLGILDFFEIKISIAGIGALLMLIGYSIDTDVLLTNRLIKEKGDNYFEKTFDAFKTGILMSMTTLFAGLIALYVTNSNVIFQISLILVIGLLVDMVSTWIQNAGILLWWLERKNN